jgi:hypothetical protein
MAGNVEAQILSAATVLAGFLIPAASLVAMLMVVDARQRARGRVIAHQIMLTDAIHAELGALVAPVVEKHVFRPWRVIYPMPDGRTTDVARLITIADRVLHAELRAPNDLHIVFTRSAHAA